MVSVTPNRRCIPFLDRIPMRWSRGDALTLVAVALGLGDFDFAGATIPGDSTDASDFACGV